MLFYNRLVKDGKPIFSCQAPPCEHGTAGLDSAGNVVVNYVYDAWGNHAVLDANGNDITDLTHIGNLNPFRYRSYFYDTETGLYFLKTRYYDPEIGRFITIDGIEYLDPERVAGSPFEKRIHRRVMRESV